VIAPALDRGAVVICDRFADSTRVYQGVGRAGLRPLVDRLHALMIGCEPDLTLLIDIDPRDGLARAAARGGGEARFEGFGAGLQERLRAGFLALARQHPARFVVIDGARPVQAVAGDVARAAEVRLA
jgi:dTMP kinase